MTEIKQNKMEMTTNNKIRNIIKLKNTDKHNNTKRNITTKENNNYIIKKHKIKLNNKSNNKIHVQIKNKETRIKKKQTQHKSEYK